VGKQSNQFCPLLYQIFKLLHHEGYRCFCTLCSILGSIHKYQVSKRAVRKIKSSDHSAANPRNFDERKKEINSLLEQLNKISSILD
jgi:hypothetical protein